MWVISLRGAMSTILPQPAGPCPEESQEMRQAPYSGVHLSDARTGPARLDGYAPPRRALSWARRAFSVAAPEDRPRRSVSAFVCDGKSRLPCFLAGPQGLEPCARRLRAGCSAP